MKCDKLKAYKNIECAFNTTTQQEQVIAEDSDGNCYGFDSWEEVYLKEDVDAAIAELKANLEKAIAERDGNQVCIDALKQKLESVDAGMENRRLKRALWLARAYRAKEMCQRLLIQGFDPKWEEVERKCLKKAEADK